MDILIPHLSTSTFPYVTEMSKSSISSGEDANASIKARTSSTPYVVKNRNRGEGRDVPGSVSMIIRLRGVDIARWYKKWTELPEIEKGEILDKCRKEDKEKTPKGGREETEKGNQAHQAIKPLIPNMDKTRLINARSKIV